MRLANLADHDFENTSFFFNVSYGVVNERQKGSPTGLIVRPIIEDALPH